MKDKIKKLDKSSVITAVVVIALILSGYIYGVTTEPKIEAACTEEYIAHLGYEDCAEIEEQKTDHFYDVNSYWRK